MTTLKTETLDKSLPYGWELEMYATFPGGNGTAPGRVVVAHNAQNNATPWCCWVQNAQTGGCAWGVYKKNREGAIESFHERVNRYCN